VDWFWTSYVALGVACTILELVRPARRVQYFQWGALPFDLVTLVVVQFGVARVAIAVTGPISAHLSMPAVVVEIPLAARVAIVYVLADFGAYWVHRLIHTRHLWRIHRFHHSPSQLYWLAGVRNTIPQQILFNLPVAFVLPLIADAPLTVLEALVIANVVTNDWMHINVAWRSNWLEKIFVTPRYHHIHHSTDAKLHDGNFGVVFSIWDRLFGTYVDPDTTRPKKFGTGEAKRDPVLLMLGI
jgi:sterol desaturase/sphingolipid hydroxylase (fatty acid hydroxylase superfamily)